MHKSNFQPGAFELGLCAPGSSDIKLMGAQALVDCDEDAQMMDIGEDYELKNVIGVDYRCYYLLEKVDNDNAEDRCSLVLYEKGVGTIIKRDKSLFLTRDFPIVWGNSIKEEYKFRSGQSLPDFSVRGYIRVSSLIPPTYVEALASPHSVIASTSPFIPSPVEIEENALLGRIGDVIQSVDMDELREMISIGNDAIEALEATQKQLKLKARRVDLTRKDAMLSAPILRAAPKYTTTTRPKAQQGSIIFNTDTKCLEFFDGQYWMSLRGHRDGAV